MYRTDLINQFPAGRRAMNSAKSQAESDGGDYTESWAPAKPGLGTIGQYRLLEKIGEGGMGTVYKALHTRLDKLVALKVLPIIGR